MNEYFYEDNLVTAEDWELANEVEQYDLQGMEDYLDSEE